MSLEFLNYLEGTVTQERKLVFQEAIDVLTKAGITDHQFHIDQLMHMDDIGDTNAFMTTIEQYLNTAIQGIMLQFGVVLDHACPLDITVDVLKATLAMDNWSEPAALSAACESDEAPEAVFAVLLSLTGAFHDAVYLPHLTRVSMDLLERIDALNQSFSDSALPSEEERHRAQLRLEAFFERYSAPILSQAIGEMLLIGGPYHALMEPYSAQISQLPLETAVNELTGFALVSELPNAALYEAITTECQGWWDKDPSVATKLATLINARLKEAKVQ